MHENGLTTVKNRTDLQTYVKYTCLFVLIATGIYAYFYINGKSLINSADGCEQYFAAILYLNRWFKNIISNVMYEHEIAIHFWDYSFGFGDDILTTLHYYGFGDPLTLPALIIPEAALELYYNIICFVRLWLAGVAFIYLCRKNRTSLDGSVYAAITYCFGGFALGHTLMYPMFSIPLFYLPLVLAGHKAILEHKNPKVFVLAIAFLSLSSFYFTYMIVILIALWTIFVLSVKEKSFNIKKIIVNSLRIAGFGLLGIAVSGVIIWPIINFFANSTRLGLKYEVPILRSLMWYVSFIFSSFSVNSPTGRGYPILSVLAVILLCNDRKRKYYLWIVILSILTLATPVFGSVMNGFTYSMNRWTFVISLFSSYLIAVEWEKICVINESTINKKIALLGMTLVYLLMQVRYSGLTSKDAIVQTGVLLVFLSVMVMVSSKAIRQNTVKIYVLLSTGIGIALFLTPLEKNYIANYRDSGSTLKQMQKENELLEQYGSITSEEDAGRLEESTAIMSNMPAVSRILGVSEYWSMVNSDVVKMRDDLFVSNGRSYMIDQQDGRTFLNALTGVKTIIRLTDERDVGPYGYRREECKTYSGYTIFRNEYPSSLVYVYFEKLDNELEAAMSPLEKQEARLQAVLLEGESSLPIKKPEITSYEVPVQIAGEYVSENEVKVFNWEGNTAYLQFTPQSDCELFLELDNVRTDSGGAEFSAESNGVTILKNYISPTDEAYCGIHNYLFNFGYSELERNNIALSFFVPKTYIWDKFRVFVQPMYNYSKYMSALQACKPSEFRLKNDEIVCSIDAPKQLALCVLVAYSKGWKAYLDGENVPILKANGYAMGIEVPKGQHRVQLKYSTPGLKEGMFISFISIIVFIVIELKYKNYR